MKKINYAFIALSAMALSTIANSDGMTVEQAKQHLERSFPNAEIDSLKPAAMSGVYEVVIAGAIYYLTEDGKFLLAGSLYDLQSGDDLTQRAYNELRSELVERLAGREAIDYTPQEYQYTVQAFSDADCPSCRNFHSQIDKVKELGIRVRYFLTPYLGDAAYKKAISIWCADDKARAMDEAKRGMPVAEKQCAHPIDENIHIAETLGIKGTPSFLLEDGRLLQGYRTPQVLLNEAKQAKQ